MSGPVLLTPEVLRAMPLPDPSDDGGKDARGRALVIAGSRQIIGAALLAAISALRAGAGKVQVGTGAEVAPQLGLMVPEALVFGLPQTEAGAIAAEGAGEAVAHAERCDAALVGPGMQGDADVAAYVAGILAMESPPPLVLDAAAMAGLDGHAAAMAALPWPAVITPHAGEMARLLGIAREDCEADPLGMARRASERFNTVTVMKGARTHIVAPDGRAWLNRSGHFGLATSGSGDTLAGIIVGLMARGARPEQAAAWGVYVHAQAGAALGRRVGDVGYLAREIPGEVPGILTRLAQSS